MRDARFPYHLARIRALEALGGGEAVQLAAAERARLVRAAFGADGSGGPADGARWLLARLAHDALDARALPPPGEPAPLPAPPGLEGLVVGARWGDPHDLVLLARVRRGRLEAAPQRLGCGLLPGAEAFPTDPARSGPVRLPFALTNRAASVCIARVHELPPGDFLATVGFRAEVEPVSLDEATVELLGGMALEALARLSGVEPADFRGTARVVAVARPAGVRAAVEAEARWRRVPLGDGEETTVLPPCVSRLCEQRRWDVDGPVASIVAVYDLAADDPPEERAVVLSVPGGCSEQEHDAVRLAGLLALEGDPVVVAVLRERCDGWQLELLATTDEGPTIVARGAAGSTI